MRKLVLSALCLASIGIASYAATFMQVKTTDGKIIEFDVESVEEVSYVKKDIPSSADTSSSLPYVDLGLPSGTLWASYNIGATKPEEYGDYFAWGETTTKKRYSWKTYEFAFSINDDLEFITKYNILGKYGEIDSLTTLLTEDDAAIANWGQEWRMPTSDEQKELCQECYKVWTYSYKGTDVSGVIFYKAKNAADKGIDVLSYDIPTLDYDYTDTHIFFPAAGYNGYEKVSDANETGTYWSSSVYDDSEAIVMGMARGKNPSRTISGARYLGLPIRAVRAQK